MTKTTDEIVFNQLYQNLKYLAFRVQITPTPI
jgi:hypothetical protein